MNKNNPYNVVTIDYGNTNPHISLVGKYGPEKFMRLNEFLELYSGQLENFTYLVSDVQGGIDKLPQVIRKNIYSLSQFKKQNSYLGMNINYSETLGEDRLYQSYYVYNTHDEGNQNILLLDIGTFLTADHINTDHGFMGGIISPGPRILYSCYEIGKKLQPVPYQDITLENSDYRATNTDQAISSGMYALYVGLTQLLIEKWKPQKVILTGGISPILKPLIEHLPVQIDVIPHHIHHALSYIYQETSSQ